VNLVAWLRMDLEENMLLTRYDWQFNDDQEQEEENPDFNEENLIYDAQNGGIQQ
jgi:hypothetical protein